jgi:hypothetical protein
MPQPARTAVLGSFCFTTTAAAALAPTSLTVSAAMQIAVHASNVAQASYWYQEVASPEPTSLIVKTTVSPV